MSKIDEFENLLKTHNPQKCTSKQKVIETQTNSFVFTETKSRKRVKFEDERKRCTFWLNDEEIEMLNKLVELEDKPKYEVLGESLKMNYKKKFK